jgi:type VI secretion system ImpM family protein
MASEPKEEGPSFFNALGNLFGGGPKVVRPSWSAYGKLPLYKDFLRHGLAAQEAQAFRHWLDRGFSRHWDEDETCHSHAIAPHAFSLCFEGLARRLAGCLWGSHDQGELRRFPFALFVSLPAGGGGGDLAVLRALEEVAQAAGDLRRSVDAASDAQTFYQRVRTAPLTLRLERDRELREHLVRETAGTTVRAFADSLYGEEAPRLWPALLSYLDRRRAASRSRDRDAATPPLACRIPLSPLLPRLLQAELWSAVVLGTGARGKEPLNVMLPWKNADPEGGLLLLERNLRPDDVFAFHPAPPRYDFLEDLRRAVPGTAPLPVESWNRPLSSLLEPGLQPAKG